MQKPVANISQEYIFARMHGVWANAAKDSRLSQLVSAGKSDGILRFLEERKLGAASREQFHQNLILREINILTNISTQLDEKTAAFYRAFMERRYFENLQVLLHYRFFPEREADIDHLLVNAPCLPEMAAAELLSLKSEDAFVLALHPAIYPSEIQEIVKKLHEDKDIMFAEYALDRLAYRNLLTHAKRLPHVVREAAMSLVQMEIDIVNLCMLLRIVRTYRLDEKTVKDIWIDGGTLLPDVLTELSRLETADEFLSKLPATYREQLQPLADADLHQSENALWKMLYRKAKRCFGDYSRIELSIVAFPFLQHFETLNLGRIYEGIHFEMQPHDIMEMMIYS